MGKKTAKSAAILILALGPLTPGPALGQAVKLVVREPDPHGSPRPFRDAQRGSLADEPVPRAGDTSRSKGRRGGPRLGRRPTDSGRGPDRRVAPDWPPVRDGRIGMAANQERPLGRPVARRLHRAFRAPPARDAIHGTRIGRPGGQGRQAHRRHLELHHRGGEPVACPGVPARSGNRSGPVARPVLLGPLQRRFLLQGGPGRPDVRPDGRGPQAAPTRLELPARILDDRQRVPPAVGVPRQPAAQHRPRARDAPDRRDGAA